MSNALVSVTAPSALGKLKEADLLLLIAKEYSEGVERERKLIEMKIESLRVTKNKAEADLEAAKTNLVRDCESSLALDNGFRKLSNQLLAVLEPLSFSPLDLTNKSNPILTIVSRGVTIYSDRVEVQLRLRLPYGSKSPESEQAAFESPFSFYFQPIPRNIENLWENVRKIEEELDKLKSTMSRLSNLSSKCHEFAHKELAKARLAAATGAETVLDKGLLAGWIQANLTT